MDLSTRVELTELSSDGTMSGQTTNIDGQVYFEWRCDICHHFGRSPAASTSWESDRFLGWMRQHYSYNENHISLEEWQRHVDAAAHAALQSPHCQVDQFGHPYLVGVNVFSQDEIAYAQDRNLPIINTTGQEVKPSGTIFLPVPTPAPRKRGPEMASNPTTSVTLYDLDVETYAAVLAVVNGDTPAAPAPTKGKKEKDEKPAKTAEEDFKADDGGDSGSDSGSGDEGGSEPEERKVYSEKELTKLGNKTRDNLVPIADALGITDEIKGKRVPKVIELILAAQIEQSEPDGDESAKDSDDFKEDEPKSDKKAKGGKDKKKGKKGKKG